MAMSPVDGSSESMPERTGTPGVCVTSMVLGIGSLGGFFVCLGPLALPFAVAAVICGHIGRKKALGLSDGRGMALAGMITGYIALAFSVLGIAFLGFMIGTDGFEAWQQ